MLKKTEKSSKRMACPSKPSIQCSVCNISSTKTAFYMCDSGYIVCENCRQSGDSKSRQDSGDFVLAKCSKHCKTQKNTKTQTKDLAIGDHKKRKKAPSVERKSKSEFKINVCKEHVETKNSPANKKAKKELETTVEYRNDNYHEDKSSSCSLASTSSMHDVECITELPKLPENHVCPRLYQYLILEFTGPVKCPVGECNKMIALDSVMLHFCFDHSKVPRMTLNSCTPRNLKLKPSNLSFEAQCLGIFLLQESNDVSFCHKVASGMINISDCKSLLLIGAKIQTEKIKNRHEKSYTTPISIRNVCTQTGVLRKDVIVKNNNVLVKNREPYKSVAQNVFDENDIILLWLCKQDDDPDSYSISVLRKDKRQGYNYIGEAVHIRNEQTPEHMFQRADCLVVNGTALNRLLDEKDQFSIFINVLE